MSEQDFNWNNAEDKEDIVFPTTQGVAVYLNQQNNVVIRQQAGPMDDDDEVIIVPKDQVENLILALQNMLRG